MESSRPISEQPAECRLLHMLPVEMLLLISNKLGVGSKTSLSQTCRVLREIVRKQLAVSGALREEEHKDEGVSVVAMSADQRGRFLETVARDMPGHWVCRVGRRLHAVDTGDVPYRTARPPGCYKTSHRHVQLALKYGRMDHESRGGLQPRFNDYMRALLLKCVDSNFPTSPPAARPVAAGYSETPRLVLLPRPDTHRHLPPLTITNNSSLPPQCLRYIQRSEWSYGRAKTPLCERSFGQISVCPHLVYHSQMFKYPHPQKPPPVHCDPDAGYVTTYTNSLATTLARIVYPLGLHEYKHTMTTMDLSVNSLPIGQWDTRKKLWYLLGDDATKIPPGTTIERYGACLDCRTEFMVQGVYNTHEDYQRQQEARLQRAQMLMTDPGDIDIDNDFDLSDQVFDCLVGGDWKSPLSEMRVVSWQDLGPETSESSFRKPTTATASATSYNGGGITHGFWDWTSLNPAQDDDDDDDDDDDNGDGHAAAAEPRVGFHSDGTRWGSVREAFANNWMYDHRGSRWQQS